VSAPISGPAAPKRHLRDAQSRHGTRELISKKACEKIGFVNLLHQANGLREGDNYLLVVRDVLLGERLEGHVGAGTGLRRLRERLRTVLTETRSDRRLGRRD
jgi:hypothetical protein